MKKLQKTSETVTALDPSQEFTYTWVDLHKNEVGSFFRTEKEAFEDAKTNFHDFTISCNVIIVQALTGTLQSDKVEEDDFLFNRKLTKKEKKNLKGYLEE